MERTGKHDFPYVLHGPKGGRIEAIRNRHSGKLYLMQGARTLPGFASDETGAIVYDPHSVTIWRGV